MTKYGSTEEPEAPASAPAGSTKSRKLVVGLVLCLAVGSAALVATAVRGKAAVTSFNGAPNIKALEHGTPDDVETCKPLSPFEVVLRNEHYWTLKQEKVLYTDYCGSWCNTENMWGCGVAEDTTTGYKCNCDGCNGCDGTKSTQYDGYEVQIDDMTNKDFDKCKARSRFDVVHRRVDTRTPAEQTILETDYCGTWCNTEKWGCGVNLDTTTGYMCDCQGCNDCDYIQPVEKCEDDFMNSRIDFCSDMCNSETWECSVSDTTFVPPEIYKSRPSETATHDKPSDFEHKPYHTQDQGRPVGGGPGSSKGPGKAANRIGRRYAGGGDGPGVNKQPGGPGGYVILHPEAGGLLEYKCDCALCNGCPAKRGFPQEKTIYPQEYRF